MTSASAVMVIPLTLQKFSQPPYAPLTWRAKGGWENFCGHGDPVDLAEVLPAPLGAPGQRRVQGRWSVRLGGFLVIWHAANHAKRTPRMGAIPTCRGRR